MKKNLKKIIWTIIIVIIIWVIIWLCVYKNDWVKNNKTWLANPASTNCIQKWGKIEMRQNKKWEYGVCFFEDNRQCEERALLRGDCPVGGMKVTGYQTDAEVYCAISWWEVQGLDTDTPMCKRVDGTLCNAQANLDGDCPDPYDPNPSAGNVEAK